MPGQTHDLRAWLGERLDECGLVDVHPRPRRVGLDSRRQSDREIAKRIVALVREAIVDDAALHLRPTLSNPSTKALASVTNMDWAHTMEAGKWVYVNICATTDTGFGGQADYPITVTVGGVEATRWVSWYSGGSNGIMRTWVFTYKATTSGAVNIAMTTTSAPWDYSAVAFNVANGPTNGAVVLPGGWWQFGDVTTLTKTAYGWADDGLQIALAFAQQGTTPAITQGSEVASVTGLTANAINTSNGELTVTATRGVSGALGLFSYLIPPKAQRRTGAAYYPIFLGQCPVDTVAPGDSLQVGLPNGTSGSPTGSTGRQGNILPIAGTFRGMAVRASQTLNTEIRCEIIRNAVGDATGDGGTLYPSGTGVFITLSPSVQEDVLEIDFEHFKYERLSLQYTNIGDDEPSSGIVLTASFLDEVGVASQTFGGGVKTNVSQFVDTEYRRAALHPPDTNWTSAGNFLPCQKSLTGLEATVDELVIDYQVPTSVEIDQQYYVEYDGVKQDGTGGSVDTTATLIPDSLGPALARARFSVTMARAKFVTVVGYVRDDASDKLRAAATVVVTPTTRGAWMASGMSDFSSSVDMVSSLNNAGANHTTTLANEARFVNIVPPMASANDDLHVRGGIAVLESTGPGTGNTLQWLLRKNEAATSMPPILFSNAEVGPAETEGDVAYESAAHIGTFWDDTGTADHERQFWSIPGYIAPPAGQGVIGPHIWINFGRTQRVIS